MSKWGKELEINGAVFAVNVTTGGFDAIDEHSRIDEIILIDDGGDKDMAEKLLIELKQKLIGRTYMTWTNPGKLSFTPFGGEKQDLGPVFR